MTFLFALLLGAAPAQAQPALPAWLGREPLIIVGNWDSMPIFRRRVGSIAPGMEEDYVRQHSEEAVLKLKELGVTMAVIHFYKGFGLEAERPHMEDARKYADLLHKHGLRVGVYVGSTIGFETFLDEKPEAADWFVQPFLGRPVLYGNQTFRKRVYFMHPGYREYMKRVLTIALRDFKADLIHFDNTSMQAQPPIFHHPRSVDDFRAFLSRKYTGQQRVERFGFDSVRHVEPPAWDRPLPAIDDPLFQEWADFRCEQLSAYYAEMERHIRGLNPQAAVESNPHHGISGRNTVWEEGVDYPRLLSHMDVVWTEEGNEAQVTPEGVLVSKIRTYKMAAQLGNRVFTYTGGGRGGKLQMAEAMAFNRQTLGQIGSALAGYDFPAAQKPYVKFFRDNFELFREVRSAANVAVLHGFASMGYSSGGPWEDSMLVQQALLQAKVPYDLIFDAQLSGLSKYRALVLPAQECLSDAQIAVIRKFVEGGGGLVQTGETAAYDQWRRRRAKPGLAGTGVHIAVKPAMKKPPAAPMTSQYWKLPLNAAGIAAAVRKAAGGAPLEVTGPPALIAEPLEQEGRVLVHLLNYDDRRAPSLQNVEVAVRVPEGRKVKAVRVLSPDASAAVKPVPVMRGRMAAFTVPRIQTYSIAVVDFE